MSDLSDLYETKSKDERIRDAAPELLAMLRKMYSFGEPVKVEALKPIAKQVFRDAQTLITKLER
jgi:hypothetical protein